MGAKTVNKKLIKKRERIRNQKNCIPPTVKANDPGEYDGVDEYRDFRPKSEHVSIKDRVDKGKKLNKQKPWYYLTKKESIAINSKRESTKMTHRDYIEGYLKQKMSKWENKHPEPAQDDLFYKEEYPKWRGARFEFAALLSQKTAKKETVHCKQNMCKYCFDYKKCNEEFLKILGYTLDKYGNSDVSKAA